MATYEQLMDAARVADAAGETADAKRLLEMAQSARAPATATADTAPARPQGRFEAAAEGIANDISAGQQGVNPVALAEQRGKAVGVLKTLPGTGMQVVDVDGTMEPAENYPAGRFVTRQEGGVSYIYPRTPDIDESRAASAGRLLGYGVVEQFGRAAKAATAALSASQAAEAVGVTPSFAMRGTVPAKIAAAGEQFAPTAGRLRQDAGRVTGEIAAAAGKLADRAGPGITPAEAGEALQSGSGVFVKGVRDFQRTLYGKVDEAIPASTAIAAPETVALLDREVSALAELPNIAKALGNGTLEGWLADLKGGSLTWQAARKLRSEIGEAIGKISGPTANMAQGRLKAIYGTLSDDLRAAAEAAGPEAAQAWSRATAYTRASEARIDEAFARILKADSPERAYSILTGMAAEGTGKANAGALRQVFKALPADEKAVVAGTIIRRLGRATAGAQDAAGEAFSPATFLTNWNRMSPEARGIIAGGGLDDGVGEGLTRLAQVVEKAKESGTFRNTSNTGNVASSIALGGGLVSAPVTTIMTALGSHVIARGLTDARFLHALNRFAAHGHADALRRIARENTPLGIEAATILRLQAPEASLSTPPDRAIP